MRQVIIDEEKKMNSNERNFSREREVKERVERETEKKTTNDNYAPIKKFFLFDKYHMPCTAGYH